MNKDFSLQHQILQRCGAQGRLFHFHGSLFRLLHGREPRGNYVETLVIDFSAQRLQAFLVTGLVRIDFRTPIEAFSGFLVIVFRAIEIEELHQRLRVVRFAIGCVVELCQKFQHVRGRPVRSHHFLHCGQERPSLATTALEDLEFVRECNRLYVEFGIEHFSDQVDNLMHARWILFEHLPDQRFAIHATSRRQQSLRIQITQF